MGEQLTMLDTMFLELEQIDESAHMHIGAALIFEPVPAGGAPDIGELRDHIRARMGVLPRFTITASWMASVRSTSDTSCWTHRRKR